MTKTPSKKITPIKESVLPTLREEENRKSKEQIEIKKTGNNGNITLIEAPKFNVVIEKEGRLTPNKITIDKKKDEEFKQFLEKAMSPAAKDSP